MTEVFADFHINDTRVAALRLLADRGEAGCSQTEMASALSLADSSICNLVDRMQEDGLIFRFRSRSDRRKSLLMLSRSGADLLEAVEAAQTTHLLRWLSQVPDAELEQIGAWLEQLTNRIPSAASADAKSPFPGLDGAWKEAG
jgi:DNA-binding MarR family transcriptional regulator